jgi:hypothetical protein
LNELVSNRLRYKLCSTAVTQKLLIKYLIDLVCEFNGNLDVDIVFGHGYPLDEDSTANLIRLMDNQWLIGASLEPEVHIVDRYLQLVKKCFTMTNVMLEGGKEIDLLAVNPISAEKYHIEVRVAIGKGFRLRLIDTQTKNGRKHRRGMDTLNEIKFAHPTVVKAVKGIFGSSDYRKVLVVWDVEDRSVIEQAKSLYDIEIWIISNIMGELIREVKTKPYRDDVLRTIQLISRRVGNS